MISCLLSWILQPFQNKVYCKRKEIALRGATSFKKLTPYEMGGKIKIKKEFLPLKVNRYRTLSVEAALPFMLVLNVSSLRVLSCRGTNITNRVSPKFLLFVKMAEKYGRVLIYLKTIFKILAHRYPEISIGCCCSES